MTRPKTYTPFVPPGRNIPAGYVLTKQSTKPNDYDWSEAQGGGASRLLRFDFAFDTPNLNTGIEVYTPAVGEMLLNVSWLVTEAFDGTTPKGDVGTFIYTEYQGSTPTTPNQGLISLVIGGGIDLSYADGESEGFHAGMFNDISGDRDFAQLCAQNNYAAVPTRFIATNPLKLVVSQTGFKGGDPIGGSAGAASLYLLIATPEVIGG